MNTQDIVSAVTALFMVGMIWLRTRVQYSQQARGPLRLQPGMHRYLPALASQLGGRIAEVVVNHRPRRFGRSKHGLSRTFRVVSDLTRLRSLMREAVDQGRPPAELAGIYVRLAEDDGSYTTGNIYGAGGGQGQP